MKITPLKMWVQNVLPVVYDDSLSYYEMVGKINEKTNEIIKQVNENTDGIEALNYVIQQLGDVDELKALLEEVETIVSDLYSSDTPIMDSENGSAGVADHAARSDHSHPSDSSKADVSLGITGALAGQYVRIKTVESGVPTEFENYMPHEIPSGGTTGQALRKESNGDYATDWDDVHEIPSGGTTGQALRKESNADYAADWSDVHDVPSGGTTGQALKKNSNTNYDASWSDTHEIPNGGSDGDVLIKDGATPYNSKWTNTPTQMGSLATINKTQLAEPTNGYKKGDYLVYNGQLYKVTTNISQWQTLVPGDNVQLITNGGINDLKSTIPLYEKGRYTFAEIPFFGWVTASATALDCYSFIPQLMPKNAQINIESIGGVIARTSTGTNIPNVPTGSGLDLQIVNLGAVLRIIIFKNGGYGVTNNIIVSGVLQNVVLTIS